jgi:hypothetical protein
MKRDLKSELVSYVIDHCESLSDMSVSRHDSKDLVVIMGLCYKSKDVERARDMFVDCLREDVDDDFASMPSMVDASEELVRKVMAMKIGEQPK